jgi:hypothetical protein
MNRASTAAFQDSHHIQSSNQISVCNEALENVDDRKDGKVISPLRTIFGF